MCKPSTHNAKKQRLFSQAKSIKWGKRFKFSIIYAIKL